MATPPPEPWCDVCACPASDCLACDACLTVSCWHDWVMCEQARTAGTITQEEARRRAQPTT